MRNIFEQLKGIDSSQIELIVSDNYSNDCTELICAEFSKIAPCAFRYYRNNENIGFDGNILSLYTKATGKYVWFLSDDDTILSGKVRRIALALEEGLPDLCYANVMVNGRPFVVNNKSIELTPFCPTGYVKLKTDTVFSFSDNHERLLAIRLCSFISSCIVKRNPTIIPQLNTYIGTGIMQDAIMNLSLSLTSTAFISSDAIVMPGEKEYFSAWFMESVIFGTNGLYGNKLLWEHDFLCKKIAINSCRFGLGVLSSRRVNEVRYPVNFMLLLRILKEYRFQSIFLIKELFLVYLPFTRHVIKRVILLAKRSKATLNSVLRGKD